MPAKMPGTRLRPRLIRALTGPTDIVTGVAFSPRRNAPRHHQRRPDSPAVGFGISRRQLPPLCRIFPKLGITSRAQLRSVVAPVDARPAAGAQ